MVFIPRALTGSGFAARAARGSAFTALGYIGAQALRLVANLLLTRLLFPEAFGLMALVQVFLTGLVMFSDVGLGPAISQNRRGDDSDFLNTAWTIQASRGAMMWAGACLLAWPVSLFYGEPLLAQLLPVAALTLVIAGFNPTRIETANRHLLLGRVTVLDLASQVAATVAMLALAWATRSVWSLVLGSVLGSLVKLYLMHRFLPGETNRFRWEPEAVRELVRFGKWIYLSTACAFLIAQGDKAILGAYLPLDTLGIYNIGFFLATFPILLGGAVAGRVLIPVYREHPPKGSSANFARLRRMRFAVTALIMAMMAVLALTGVPLVHFLYPVHFAAAGPMLVLIACVQLPSVIWMTYDQSALAAGDSRNFFLVIAARTALQTLAFLAGAQWGGLSGALVAQGVAMTAGHGLTIWLARRHGAWDPLHDAIFAALAALAVGAAVWLNLPALATLAGK